VSLVYDIHFFPLCWLLLNQSHRVYSAGLNGAVSEFRFVSVQCLASSHSHILLRNHSNWWNKGFEKGILIHAVERFDSTDVVLGYHTVS
jgi:hypothetical protein